MNKDVTNSKSVNKTLGVSWSNCVNLSYGINKSYCVNLSNSVSCSYGVNGSNSVNCSLGVNISYGVNGSNGVNGSYGVNRSYGIFNSYGVDCEIFCANKERKHRIFGTVVSEKRFKEVFNDIETKSNGWYPRFNNAIELYNTNGGDWGKVEASKINSTLFSYKKPFDAWSDIPAELLDYIRSLPEFNADIFETVTGITGIKEVEEKLINVAGVNYKVSDIEKALASLTPVK